MTSRPTLVRAEVASCKPTAEANAQRAGIAAPLIDSKTFRPGWLVITRLDKLLEDQLITDAGYRAARRWQSDWEAAMERSRGMPTERRGRSTGSGGGPTARLAALARLRTIEQALGRFAVGVLVLCVIRDAPWTRLAAYCSCSDKTARGHAAKIITALAAWQRADRAG